MAEKLLSARRWFVGALICAAIGAVYMGVIAATSQDNPLVALIVFAYLLGCLPALLLLYFIPNWLLGPADSAENSIPDER